MIKRIFILLLLLVLPLFASDEIRFYDGVPNLTKCYTITNDSNHCYWNFPTSTFAGWVDKASRSAALTEDIGKCWYGATPPANLGAGKFSIASFDCSVALFDPNFGASCVYTLPWTGSAIYNPEEDANIAATHSKNADNKIDDVNEHIKDFNDHLQANYEMIISTGGEGPWTSGGTAEVNDANVINAVNSAKEEILTTGGEGPWTSGGTVEVNDANVMAAIKNTHEDVNVIKAQMDPNNLSTLAGRIKGMWLNSGSGGFGK